jgi:hypothetical protein
MTESEVKAAYKAIDSDSDGELSFEEFHGWWAAQAGKGGQGSGNESLDLGFDSFSRWAFAAKAEAQDGRRRALGDGRAAAALGAAGWGWEAAAPRWAPMGSGNSWATVVDFRSGKTKAGEWRPEGPAHEAWAAAEAAIKTAWAAEGFPWERAEWAADDPLLAKLAEAEARREARHAAGEESEESDDADADEEAEEEDDEDDEVDLEPGQVRFVSLARSFVQRHANNQTRWE